MKFGQLILRRIVKIVGSECQILRLKCTKIDFGWGSAPDPAGGAYSAPQGQWTIKPVAEQQNNVVAFCGLLTTLLMYE